MLQKPEDISHTVLDYIMDEWRCLQPLGDVLPPRGVWILAHEPIPPDHLRTIQSPIASGWFGNAEGLHPREVDIVERLRVKGAAWEGVPYFRWGWVDFAQLVTEPIYYLTFLWGGRYGYGLLAAVTANGIILRSSHLWQA